MFEQIVQFLQYEVERPKSYGLFHLISILISVLLIVYLVLRKEKNHEKSLKVVLGIYGFGTLILEICKQIAWGYDLESGIWGCEWGSFPFQLCSTPIYISIICLFLKKNKVRDSLLSYVAFVTILGSLATVIYPETCFVRTLVVNFHTIYMHFGSLVVSIYIISKEIDVNFKNYLRGYFVFLIIIGLALIMNLGLYNSSLLNGRYFNMFYISPYYTSELPVFNIVQENIPYILFLLFYLLMLFLGSFIVFIVSKQIKKIKSKI